MVFDMLRRLAPLVLTFMVFFLYYAQFISISVCNFLVVLISTIVLFNVSRIPALQLILCFCYLFPFYTLAYTNFGFSISDYSRFQTEYLFSQFLFVHSLFFSGIAIAIKSSKSVVYLSSSIKKYRNDYVFYASLIMILTGCFLFRGVNIFTTSNPYEAYVNNLSVESGLPEYLLVIIFLSFLFKPPFKASSFVFFVVVSFYCYKLITLGYRVQFLMAFLLVFILLFEKFLKKYYALFCFFVGFIVFSSLGYLKDGGLNNFDLAHLIFDTSPGFVLSHHTGVIYSSLAILGNIELGLITLLDRLYSNLGILLNTLVPSGIVNTSIPQSNMSIYVKSLTDTAGGVYAPLVFHVSFFPYVGPLLFGFLIGRLFTFSSNYSSFSLYSENKFLNLSNLNGYYVTFIFATFPRWVSYDIGNFLFRLPLYMLLLILVYNILVYLTSKKCSLIN